MLVAGERFSAVRGSPRAPASAASGPQSFEKASGSEAAPLANHSRWSFRGAGREFVYSDAIRFGPRYRLDFAASGQEFLERLRRQPPHAIIADEKGPPGLALEQLLEAAKNGLPPVPVLVLGENRSERHARRILALGAADYVAHSGIARLKDVVERCLLREKRLRETSSNLAGQVDRLSGLVRDNAKLITAGRLSAAIAHEIKNPLEGVANLLYLMYHEPGISSKLRDYLDLARREVGRAAQISNQTLNFHRETAAPVRLWIGDLVEEVMVLFGSRLAAKQIEVVRRYESKEPLRGFPGEMRQVISNLVANAIEVSPVGGKLYLRLRRSRHWADRSVTGMRLTVADQGSGIPSEIRQNLGQMFFTTKGQAGTGLGLWITQSILSRNGGQLSFRSRIGDEHGAVFSAFFPDNLRLHSIQSGRKAEAGMEDRAADKPDAASPGVPLPAPR